MKYEMTLRARAMRPDFKFMEFAGGGVDIVDQQSQAWVAAIQQFIRA